MKEQEMWLGKLEREKKAHKAFRDMAERSSQAYWRFGKTPASTGGTVAEVIAGAEGFPIWWSNTQITQAAIFNRPPKPDVRRRVQDSRSDKNISTAIERAISYQIDTTPFFEHAKRSVQEFLYTSIGVSRLYLKTETEDKPVINPVTQQPIMGEDEQPLMSPQIVGQYVCLEYVPWDLFRWEPCKDWEDCQWVSFDRWLSAGQIKREFDVDIKEKGGSDSSEDKRPSQQKYHDLHLVHEIWDKRKRQIITVCSTADKDTPILKKEPDKYGLKTFFPCPRPMMLNIRSGELTPTPEYHWIEKMCTELDDLTCRIRGLVAGLKDVSAYDASFGPELANILREDDGARIAVNGLIQKLEQGKLQNLFITDDHKTKVETLVQLVQQRERAKMELFEMTGIADIVRGATKASETATAQQIKTNWASVRLGPKTSEIGTHFRDVFRIMAELISEHFQVQQLVQQTGVQITPEMQAIMKSDMGRSYAIDVESDSTIAQDEEETKAERLEFVQGFTKFAAELMPLQSQGILSADLTNAVLKFWVASHRHGRVLEEQIDALPGTQEQMQGLQQQAQQAQQQVEQTNQQLQQIQAESQKQIQQLMQKVQDLELQIQVAKQEKPIDPAKIAMDMANARKADAQANKAETEAIVAQQQLAMGQLLPVAPQ